MVFFENLPDYPLSFIVRYLSQHPADFLTLLTVCKSWIRRFDNEDAHIWKLISGIFRVTLHTNVRSSVGLRSKYKLKQVFLKACHKHHKEIQDKHDLLVLQARNLLSRKSDSPKFLLKLIVTTFPDLQDFNPNYRCPTVESNTLLTLSARYTHLKCMKVLVDQFRADINVAEGGGFSPLVLCAFNGNLPAVRYLVGRGADITMRGRLRSGALLTAEHWAAVRGWGDVCSYLRVVRLKGSVKIDCIKETESPAKSACTLLDISSESTSCPLSPSSSSLQLTTSTIAPIPLTPLKEMSTESAYSNTSQAQEGQKWCVCGGAFEGGAMIACDSPQCVLEWYHFDCAGIVTPPPPDASWLCPECIGDQFPEPPLKRKGSLLLGEGKKRKVKRKAQE
ncbi:hypothetical protein EON65_06200 [archaeon]|nr:MAG: hypothetical protein EON65_06200 [archaeon]